MVLFDTHAHLHFDEFEHDRAEVLARARRAGVRRFLTVGIDVETSRTAVALAQAEPDCYATVGLHPHEATAATDATWAMLRELAASSRVVALGEMGLDYFRNRSLGSTLNHYSHQRKSQPRSAFKCFYLCSCRCLRGHRRK